MRKIILTLAIMISSTLCAGDMIITRDSQKIDVKIIEVSRSEIKYKELDNPDGPTFILEVTDISSIIYESGKVQLYNNPTESIEKDTHVTSDYQTTSKPNIENQTSKSVVITSGPHTENPMYIIRSGNKYIYNGQTMQGRVFKNAAYTKFLEQNCQPAQKKFETGTIIAACGWGCLIGGATVDVAFSWWLPAAAYGALVAEVASIPLLITGYSQMHRSAEIFNMQCAHNTNYSWSINSSKNGLGVSFNF